MSHEILRLGHLGDGIAEGPDGPIRVARVLPGEIVDGRIENARIDAPIIERASPDRIKPPCAHARACGGCALQHASDQFVANWKVEVIRRAMEAQGLPVPDLAITTSPPRSRRRATLAARRGKNGVTLGFHAPASDHVVAVPGCILLHPDLMALFPALVSIAEIGASRRGLLSLSVTRSMNGVDVLVRGGKDLDAALRATLAGIAEAAGFARLTWQDEIVAMRAAPRIRLGQALVTPPPGAFLQATAEGQTDLTSAVIAATAGSKRVADLFSGLGTFAFPLAETAQVHAVEGEAAMIAALSRGWRETQGLKQMTFETRDLFRRPLLAEELVAFDAVVLDPPRSGALAQTEAVARAKVPVVAAVSCNPVTFARDARILVGAGYRLDWIRVVDQFRWSTHVELAARFSHSHIAAQ